MLVPSKDGFSSVCPVVIFLTAGGRRLTCSMFDIVAAVHKVTGSMEGSWGPEEV